MHVAGTGIDIVSISRVRKFIRSHGFSKASRLLTPSEKQQLKRSRTPILQFSKLFVAKEAFSKAMGVSLSGIEGFKALRVKILPENHFRVKSVRSGCRPGREAQGGFFKSGDILGAQVTIWDS